MAVFPDRIVLKNSTDPEASIVAAIESGGTDEISQGELVVGREQGAVKLYALDAAGDIKVISGAGGGGGGGPLVAPFVYLPLDGDTNDYGTSGFGLDVTGGSFSSGIISPPIPGREVVYVVGSSGWTNATAAQIFDFAYNQDFTFDFWAQNPGTGYDFRWINNIQFYRGVNSSGGTIGINWTGHPSSTTYDRNFYGTFHPGAATNLWCHIAYTRSNGIVRGFVNGDKVLEVYLPDALYKPNTTSSTQFGGSISDIRLIKDFAWWTDSFDLANFPYGFNTKSIYDSIGYDNIHLDANDKLAAPDKQVVVYDNAQGGYGVTNVNQLIKIGIKDAIDVSLGTPTYEYPDVHFDKVSLQIPCDVGAGIAVPQGTVVDESLNKLFQDTGSGPIREENITRSGSWHYRFNSRYLTLTNVALSTGVYPTGSGKAFEFGTQDFTLECWIRDYNGTVSGHLFSSAHETTDGFNITLSNGIATFKAGTALTGRPSNISTTTSVNDGEWHHFAMCRRGTVYALYVDGIEEARTVASSVVDYKSYYNLIGASHNSVNTSTNSLNGIFRLDDIRVTKGVARYNDDFTPYQGNLQGNDVFKRINGDPNTGDLLQYDGTNWVNTNPLVGDLGDVDDTGILKVSDDDGYALAYDDNSGNYTPQEVRLIDNLYSKTEVQSFWPNVGLQLHGNGVDGGTIITDSSINQLTPAVQGSAITTSTLNPYFGTSSLRMNGSSGDGNFEYQHPNLFNTRTADGCTVWSIDMWLYRTSTNGPLFSFANASTSDYSYRAYVINGLLYFQFRTFTFSSGVVSMPANQWFHFAIEVYPATTEHYIYVNGVLEDSITQSVWGNENPAHYGTLQLFSYRFDTAFYTTGYAQEVRFIKNSVIYGKQSFTVPTAPYPDSQYLRNAGIDIDNLNDVDTSTTLPTAGDVLTWNGTEWAPAAASAGAGSTIDGGNLETGTSAGDDTVVDGGVIT